MAARANQACVKGDGTPALTSPKRSMQAPTGVLGGGAILDSSEHFADLLPLQLMSVSGTPFSLADLRRVESGANSAALAASTLLAPPGAPESELKPAQLANQVRPRAQIHASQARRCP